MTHLGQHNHKSQTGAGRIRRVIPLLGMISAAIHGYTSQTNGASAPPPDPELIAPLVSAEMISLDVTLLHYARAQGVGDALIEDGAVIPSRLRRAMGAVAEIVAEGRTETTAYQVDMAYSSGHLEGSEGGWSALRLDEYVSAISGTQIGIRELADQATLRWSEVFGLEEGRSFVTGTIAMTVSAEGMSPIWSGQIEDGSGRSDAFLEVSGAVRTMITSLQEAAFGALIPGADPVLADREGAEKWPTDPHNETETGMEI